MKKNYDSKNLTFYNLPLFIGMLFFGFLFSGQINAQCTADAGTLMADLTPVQLAGGSVTISATVAAAPTIPTDYEVIYALTSGTNLVIEQASTSPEFTVSTPGDYTIHTLVAETSDSSDSNYLNLSIIDFGTTTAAEGLNYINTNGICAALDQVGAPVTVEDCMADAGSLTADATPVQLAFGNVMISATEAMSPTVPANYEIVYVLTSGANLVIEQTSATPEFTVTAEGDYTIHTLVAELDDANDPNFLDVSVIVPGTTTGGDLLDIVTNNGLCAALDATGAPVTVETCSANAGSLMADATPVQLAGGSVMISATEVTAPAVPMDYEVIYALTSGTNLVIQQTSATPEFTVTAAGSYTIHTLVAETNDSTDPNYLNLNIVDLGTTTAAQGLAYIRNNGLCAALDVTGAPVTVETCTADAGSLTADATPVQLNGGSVMISATEATAPTVPTNYEVVYVLTSGANLVIEQTSATPEFTVTAEGDYTIHTLVAELDDSNDPNFLDVSVIVPGTTTGGDVLNIVSNNGLCAALDVTGAPIMVRETLGVEDNVLENSIRLFPNPVVQNLNIKNSDGIFIQSLRFVDVSGRIVQEQKVDNNLSTISADLSELNSGVYFIIIDSNKGQLKKLLVKK